MADINIEEIVIGFLDANKPSGWQVFGDMPKERPEAFILVDRTGGPREFVVQDRAEILIEVYHKDSRESASDQANVIADIIKNLEVLEPVMRAKVTSLVKLEDLLGQYWRYQIYCDVYYRRDVSTDGIIYPVIPSTGAVSSVNGKTGVVVIDASDVGADPAGSADAAEAAANAYTDAEIAGIDYPVDSVNGQTGAVSLDADDIDDTTTTHKFATAAQLAKADSAIQPEDLATVATTGAYADLTGKPTIPDELTDLDTTVTGAQLNAMKTKVDGIEAGADVTDAANVEAAGAVMESDIGVTVQAHDADLDTWAAKTPPSGAVVGDTDTQTLANKTLTNPTISPTGFTNAQHAHAGASSGGQIPIANTTGTLNVNRGGTGRTSSVTAYGLIAAGTTVTGAQQTIAPGTSGQFLKSAGASALAGFANITIADVASLQTSLDAKQPLDADLTALAAAGNSGVLAATTASFTTADETKLDGIEAGADVTDAANVAAAGAVMETDTSTADMDFVIDEDDLISDSATKVPTQQSVKAYADKKGVLAYDVYTSNNTWTKPAGAKVVEVFAIGGGGGGGKGTTGAEGTQRNGGGGGGPGGAVIGQFDADDLTSTVAVTVGAGGAGATTDGAFNAGAAGSNSSFGSYVQAGGGTGGSCGSGFLGAGGGAPGASSLQVGSGGDGTYTGIGFQIPGTNGHIGSGAGGAARSSGNVYSGALAGGNSSGGSGGGGGGISVGTAGTAGANGSATNGGAGGGGGGPAAAGGNGGAGGGGGGGGGAAVSPAASGNGGSGGNGIVIVITYG